MKIKTDKKRKNRISNRPGRDGFSLLELLIVIGIISLLTGITMPAISMIRRHVKRQVTRDRVKQVALAWNLHLQENRKFNPDTIDSTGSTILMTPQTIKELNLHLGRVSASTKQVFLETSAIEYLDKGNSLPPEGTGVLDAWGEDVVRRNGISSITILNNTKFRDHEKWLIRVRLDDNGDSIVTAPGSDNTEINRPVIAWSVGPDGEDLTGDEITSWD